MEEPQVPASARRERIVELLRQQRGVTVRDLAVRFAVTSMTIRRDLDQLEESGLAIRVHGGAVAAVGARTPTREGRRRTVAMVVPDINYHWPAVTAAAQLEAGERQIRLVVRHSRSYGRDTVDHIARLTRRTAVDGLILAPYPTGPERAGLEEWLAGNDLPVVYVDREPDDPSLAGLSILGVDNEAGGAIASRHLAGLGHRRMIMMTDAAAPGASGRIAGWQRMIRTLGLPEFPVLPTVPFGRVDNDRHLGDALAEIDRRGVTAVFVNGDPQAIAVLQACHDRGIAVPEQLSIVGFDDELATLTSPPLTTIRTPKEALGRGAVRIVLQAAGSRPVQRTRLVPTLVERDSCGPPSDGAQG